MRILLAITMTTPALVVTVATAAPADASKTGTVVRWVDGDTVVTTRGTVRLIGIDTPEAGECGSKKAKRLARKLAPSGTMISLHNPRSVQNRDAYDRLLRYVGPEGIDVGLRQIRAGSRARYDSRTGYDRHPRQEKYVKVDDRNSNYKCGAAPTDKSSYPPIPGRGIARTKLRSRGTRVHSSGSITCLEIPSMRPPIQRSASPLRPQHVPLAIEPQRTDLRKRRTSRPRPWCRGR